MGDDGLVGGAGIGAAVGTGVKAAWGAIADVAAKAAQGYYPESGPDNPHRTAANPGGGFEFPSAEVIDGMIKQWDARRVSIAKKAADIEDIQHSLIGLAQDQESQGFLKTSQESIELLKNQHKSMVAFIENYIDKLNKAKEGKQANEDAAHRAVAQGQADTHP
jgi:hypothetical protein